eukprot:5620952-Prymnesium_polylepis.1
MRTSWCVQTRRSEHGGPISHPPHTGRSASGRRAAGRPPAPTAEAAAPSGDGAQERLIRDDDQRGGAERGPEPSSW